MIGAYKIRVKNSKNTYTFELRRNISILCGDSGRGKTNLYDMIHEYNRFGKNSGVSISCDRKLIAFDSDDWENELDKISGAIIVIDEDSSFIRSHDFARKVKGSDNYYLLITRNYLAELPYSVDEIFVVSGNSNKKLIPAYKEVERVYNDPDKKKLPFVPQYIITEDSNSGYVFFKAQADKLGIECVSARGKSRIQKLIEETDSDNIVIIADGAAFGAEMENVVKQQRLSSKRIAIFLPESFEWLILKSGLVDKIEPQKLESPELYADSKEYMSWEQYFSDMLIKLTGRSDYKKYAKDKLPGFYLQEGSVDAIKHSIRGIKL